MVLEQPTYTDEAPQVQAGDPGTPDWWRARLLRRLQAQAVECREFAEFYEGTQPLAFASAKFAEVFGRRYSRLPANLMPLVVEAEAERLEIGGFRIGKGEKPDAGAWDIWQRNQLDAESQIAHEIALSKSLAYVLVAPPLTGERVPQITVEDPTEVVLEYAPGNRRRRLAALKVWLDDEGHARAYLYLPNSIHKWRSEKPRPDSTYGGLTRVRWARWTDGDEEWGARNPLGEVPVVPLPNRPRRDGRGRSEITPVMGNQNAINKLRFDALVASEFVAFPQRWAINIDVPTDPDTGKPLAPFKPGVDMLWTVRRPTPDETAEYGDKWPQPQMGEFSQANLEPYQRMIDQEVGMLASVSRTPYHYLLGSPTSVPPSGESLKSSEAPLVKKVGRAALFFGEGWEEVMRLALVAAGQSGKARADGETIWADFETRNEAARTDAIIKQHQALGLPLEVTLEELGYSPTTIARIMALKAAEQAAATGTGATGGDTPPGDSTPPGGAAGDTTADTAPAYAGASNGTS